MEFLSALSSPPDPWNPDREIDILYASQVPDTGTGTPSEASFVARLCTIEEALERLKPREAHRRIVEIAWKAWRYTLDVDSGRVPLSAQGVPPASCTRA
jgi:hypothetical protein